MSYANPNFAGSLTNMADHHVHFAPNPEIRPYVAMIPEVPELELEATKPKKRSLSATLRNLIRGEQSNETMTSKEGKEKDEKDLRELVLKVSPQLDMWAAAERRYSEENRYGTLCFTE